MATPACPCGRRCESCGSEAPDLAAVIVDSNLALGPFCVTLCQPCRAAVERGTLPQVSLATAARLVAQHAAHCQA